MSVAAGEVDLAILLADDAGLATSRSEVRRLIDQGAVRIDGRRAVDYKVDAAALQDAVVQVGKRRFVRVRVLEESSTP